MALTITIDDRDWDISQITAMLVIPAQREYVAAIALDDNNGRETFSGDVVLLNVNVSTDTVYVADHDETNQADKSALPGTARWIDVADIRSISFY